MGGRPVCPHPVQVVTAMCEARHDELGVVLLAHARQFFDEGHGRPEFLIAMITPAPHSRHLDPVFEDPEELGGAIELGGLGEIRRLRIETFGDCAPRDTGRAVANGAMGGKMLDA